MRLWDVEAGTEIKKLEGHNDTRPWSVDVPLCPEHLAWYERRHRQFLFLLIPFILGAGLGILSLLLVHLSLLEEGNIVTRGLLIAGTTIFFAGLYLWRMLQRLPWKPCGGYEENCGS